MPLIKDLEFERTVRTQRKQKNIKETSEERSNRALIKLKCVLGPEQHWAHGMRNVSSRLNYCFETKLKLPKAQRFLENIEQGQ